MYDCTVCLCVCMLVKNTGSLQCMFGGLGCDSPEFRCVTDRSDPTSPHSVCSRRCGFNNGGCGRDQWCVERQFCVNCSTSEDSVMEGSCLNAGSGECIEWGQELWCAVGRVRKGCAWQILGL